MLQLPKGARPDFFVVGTMKGGTTILYDFICSHPSVLRAKEKEIHFFSLYPEKGMDWYLSNFDFTQGKITGEASPSYFDVAYTAAIPKWIKAVNPDAKIILITRDPVERAVSHFFHLKNINRVQLFQGMEINDFFSLSFKNTLKQTSQADYFLQQILYFSSYTRKLRTYRSVFDSDKILILDNNELRESPEQVMRQVFDFLELPNFESANFRGFKYSSGKDSSVLNPAIKKKLSDFLYEDYKVYCQESGLRFNEPAKQEQYVNGDTLIGKDGWLFLAGGGNAPLDYYLNKIEFGGNLIRGWCELLRERQHKLIGIKYVHLFVPNKESVYDHKTGLDPIPSPGSPLISLFRNASGDQRKTLEDICINPIAYFKRIRESFQLYWKTDSHWTPSGCYAAYQLICSRLGISPLADLLSRPFTEGTIALDLGAKLTPQVKETARFYNLCKNSYCSEANELVNFKKEHNLENEPGLHVGSRVKFTNPNAHSKLKIIIFGDSFSEYRPSLLTGMLAETFYETHFVWSTSLDYKFIGEIAPDIVITEIAERFMPIVPEDKFNVSSYPLQRIADFKKQNSNDRGV